MRSAALRSARRLWRPPAGRMSKPGCQLWRTVTGGGSRCRLALKLQHKSRRSSTSPIKEPKRENRLQIRLMEARVRSHEPTRVPAVALPLMRWLLGGMGRSSFCKSRVEARNRPQSTRKAPEKSNKKYFRTQNGRLARLVSCHRLRFPQGIDLLFPEPKPVTTGQPGPLSYTAICDPRFCASPSLMEACVDRMSEPGCPLWRATLGRVF
jgi:hypothetical protein